jgi:GGDEF domain-containing protein
MALKQRLAGADAVAQLANANFARNRESSESAFHNGFQEGTAAGRERILELERENILLSELAAQDPLTRLVNRRGLGLKF